MKDREFEGNNPYYSPEKCGLKLADELDADLSYEFEMVAIWKDVKSKRFYWDSDSGCSCPSPFEDVRRLSDLTALNKTHFKLFQDAVNGISRGLTAAEKSRFISKWRRKVEPKPKPAAANPN